MSVIAALWGLLALIFAFIAFLPLLGSLNWLVIPFAAVGIIFGYMSKDKSGAGRFSFVASIIALIVGMFRLMVGGGIL